MWDYGDGFSEFPSKNCLKLFFEPSKNRYKSSKYKEVARQESACVVFDWQSCPTFDSPRSNNVAGIRPEARRGGRRKSVEKKRKYIFMKREKESSSSATSSCSEGMFKSTSCTADSVMSDVLCELVMGDDQFTIQFTEMIRIARRSERVGSFRLGGDSQSKSNGSLFGSLFIRSSLG